MLKWMVDAIFFTSWSIFQISMGYCKKDVTPLLTHWSYIFLALTHRYGIYFKFHKGSHGERTFSPKQRSPILGAQTPRYATFSPQRSLLQAVKLLWMAKSQDVFVFFFCSPHIECLWIMSPFCSCMLLLQPPPSIYTVSVLNTRVY